MMGKRGDAELTQDILEAANRIDRYIAGLSYEKFRADTKTQDAVVRNLEILGEAAKGLSDDFMQTHAAFEWRDVARMRDRLIHHYFGVNLDIVGDVITHHVPRLRATLRGTQQDTEH